MEELKTAQRKSNSERVASYKENLGKKKKKKKKKTYIKFMVKEKDNSWGDWTGQFNLKKNEKLYSLIKRAKEHFNRHFNTEEYSQKEFAMVIVEKGIRKIIPNFSL